MSTSCKAGGVSMSPAFVLFLVFLVLKLTGVIGWSWWWVTAPLWGPIALFFGLLVSAFVIFGVFALLMVLFGFVFMSNQKGSR